MKVMMVGAGAVGGFFGARLVKAGVPCAFLLRAQTLAAVRQTGLSVHSVDQSFTVYPIASSDPRDLPPSDLIILSVKRYDLDEVIAQLRPVLLPQTTVLTLQNGVDTEARIRELVPGIPVIGGVAYIYSKVAAPGVIEHYKRGTVAIGKWNAQGAGETTTEEDAAATSTQEKGPFAKLGELRRHVSQAPAPLAPTPGVELGALKSFFEGAGIPCQVSDDIMRTKWEKMCWNVVFNPLTVLINDRVSKAISHPEMRAMIKLIVEEAVAVAKADGVDLAPDIADKVIQWSQEIRDIHTSMFDDWKAGRRTEIDHLNGYLVRRGNEMGIRTPVNEAVCALIKTITEPAPIGPVLLRLDGQVIQPLVFDIEALAKLPATEQIPDVSAEVPAMRGHAVRVRALLNVATCKIGADHVTFHSADGQYAASLHMKEAAESGILVYKRDGRPLSKEEGGPFRLITPGLGDWCANVKGVTRIEFTIGPGKDTRPADKQC
ncbi:MAG: 2-dehydropantoate 2-reductase [Nitrospirae bacterium]|nr:MAG: 2-dehydropantoate 2-reductase [Nitrospirota bacterium]